MGVLACDRTGCDNIMCDYYHSDYGYICSDCIADLQEYLNQGNVDIQHFMGYHKRKYENPFKLNAYEIFTRRD